jgi:hypothetical protein
VATLEKFVSTLYSVLDRYLPNRVDETPRPSGIKIGSGVARPA